MAKAMRRMLVFEAIILMVVGGKIWYEDEIFVEVVK